MVINDTYDNRYSPNCKLHHHHYHHHLSTEEQATIVLLRFTWSKAMAVIHLQNFQVIKRDNLMTSQHGTLSELGKYSTKKSIWAEMFGCIRASYSEFHATIQSSSIIVSQQSLRVSFVERNSWLFGLPFFVFGRIQVRHLIDQLLGRANL